MDKKFLLFGFLVSSSLLSASYNIPEDYSWDRVNTIQEITFERKCVIIKTIEYFRDRFYEYWESLVLYATKKTVLGKDKNDWERIINYFPFNFPLRKDEKLMIAAVAIGEVPVKDLELSKKYSLLERVKYRFADQARKKCVKKIASNSSDSSFSSVEIRRSPFDCLLCDKGGVSDDESS